MGKEYGDSKAQGNTWSWGDIVADGLGIVTYLNSNLVSIDTVTGEIL